MKSYSSPPTEDNALKMFSNDEGKRNEQIFRFIDLLDEVSDNCSIAIDGSWGSGKTFFVKQVKLILDSNNELSTMDSEARKKILALQAENEVICGNSYATVYYDAWENDNEQDPILSLIYTTLKSNPALRKPENIRSATKIVEALANLVPKLSIVQALIELMGEDPLSEPAEANQIHTLMKKFIDGIVEEYANQVVIFIDELDRCKPSYAIQVLERIKHYFDDDRIIFVFSSNLSQLQHTVKSYYGNEFDATRYLDKFFDLRITLPQVDYDAYISSKFSFLKGSYGDHGVFTQIVKSYQFSFREIERYARLLKIAAMGRVGTASVIDPGTYLFVQNCIVSILIALSMVDLTLYNTFINGNDSGPLTEILTHPEAKFTEHLLLNENECFSEDEKVDGIIVVSLNERIQEMYKALFQRQVGEYKTITIGKLVFSEILYQEVLRTISLLSPLANYDFD